KHLLLNPKLLLFQADEEIRDFHVTGVQTCALPTSGEPCEPVRDLVDLAGRHAPDPAQRLLLRAEPPLRIEREPDVRPTQQWLVRSEERRVGTDWKRTESSVP